MTIAAPTFVPSAVVSGLSNQAVVSIGNFGLNLVLARNLTDTDYGAFSVLLSVFLFLNALHQSLATYPLSVRGAIATDRNFAPLLGGALTVTLLLQLLFLFVLAVTAAGLGRWSLFMATVLSVALWQIYEVHRRALMAGGFYWAATVTDAVRYLGVFGLALVLAVNQALSLESVFVLIAVGSALAALAAILIAPRWLIPRWPDMASELKTHWQIGWAYLGATVLATFSSQWLLWLLALRHGLAPTAVLQALVNIAAVAAPVMFGIENVLVPEIARQRDALHFGELTRFLWQWGLMGSALIAPFFALAFFAPEWTIGALYGAQSPYAGFGLSLRLLIAAYAMMFAASLFAATLRAYVMKDGVLNMQLYPALLSITLGSWLVIELGLVGACAAALLAAILRAVTGLFYVNRIQFMTTPEGAFLAQPPFVATMPDAAKDTAKINKAYAALHLLGKGRFDYLLYKISPRLFGSALSKLGYDATERYSRMQKTFYEGLGTVSPELVVGYFDAHERFPYETYLLRNADEADLRTKLALDFGCGMGRMIKRMAPYFARVDGVDIATSNIQAAKNYTRSLSQAPMFFVNNGRDLSDIPSNTYQFVYSTIALQHIPVHAIRMNLFREFYRVLDEGSLSIQMAYVSSSDDARRRSSLQSSGEGTQLSEWEDDFFDAGSTNGKSDVVITDRTLSKVVADIAEVGFRDVTFEFSEPPHSTIYDKWIYIHARK